MKTLLKSSTLSLWMGVSGCLFASAVAAAPVVNTFAYFDGFGGPLDGKFNYGGGSLDETRVEGSGSPGDVAVTSRARAYASVTNGQYKIGARAELDADYVPAALMQPSGSFSNTAEAMAIGQIEDQLTFSAPGLQPGAYMNVGFTYRLSGNGFSCAPADCSTVYGAGAIPATEVYGEMLSSIDSGWQQQKKRIDFPAPGTTFTHHFNAWNGNATNFTLELTARVFSDSADAKALGMDVNPGYFKVHGDADYYSTLAIVGIAAVDADGAPISDFRITNSDGVALAAVPVPPALGLFGAGLLGLAGIARRRDS